ncbi:hypothetical protein J4480_04010 [Candidatus Woesearchaeota archaeon]|nr:hypothetical protein [Candidatus Woesearchaeota archaeon]
MRKDAKRIDEKIVYIIGAGASKEEGIPILKDLKCALKILIGISSNYSEIDQETLKKVSELWENSFPDKNIEEVMTCLANSKPEDYQDFKYAYVAIIIYYSYYYDYYRCIRKHPKSYSQTYVQFMRRVLLENANIISLNVDNLICDCIRLDEKLNDELFNKIDPSKKENFETISVEARREIVSCLTDSWPFEFYRIHGSVSFPNYKEGKGNDITISSQSHFQDLKNGNFRIEFPNFKKYYKNHPDFYDCSDSIKKAKKIIIIGHSFPESDKKWISNFDESVAQNTNNPIIELINPSINLENISSKHKNKMRIIPITFGKYLSSLNNINS